MPPERFSNGASLAREYFGQGHASDAVARLIGFAFETLGLHRLEADPDPQNAASIALLEKQGFKYEGLLRERAAFVDEARKRAGTGTLSGAHGET